MFNAFDFYINSHSIDMKYIKIKGRVICKSASQLDSNFQLNWKTGWTLIV